MGAFKRIAGGAALVSAAMLLLRLAVDDVGTLGEWFGGIGAFFAVAVATTSFMEQRELDIADRLDDERKSEERDRRRDLDETRRLVYMALISFDTRRSLSIDARATLANALVHHSQRLGAIDAVDLVNDLADYTNGDGEAPPLLRRDLQNLVRELSDLLGESAAAWDLGRGATRPVAHPDDR